MCRPINFKRVHSYLNSELETWFWFGKVVAPQEVPNHGRRLVFAQPPVTMEGKSLMECELGRPLSRDGYSFPAGSLIKYGDYGWTVELADDASPVRLKGSRCRAVGPWT